MSKSKFFIFLSFVFFALPFTTQVGISETTFSTSFKSVCLDCASCLAAGCPASNPEDPACAAFILSACESSSSTTTTEMRSPPPSPPAESTTTANADAEISGTVVDKEGNILADLYGFASLSKDTGFGSGLGGSIDQGKFSAKAPSGIYQLSVFLSPDSAYTAGASQTVTLLSGETTSVKVIVSKNTSKITGTLKDETGKAVTGFDAYVFATSEAGVWQEALFEKATGVYTLHLAAGTWYVGYEIDSASGFLSLYKADIQMVVGEGQTFLKDLIVVKAGSTIKGQVTDPTGKGVAYAFVGASKTSFTGAVESGEFEDPMVAGTQTDGGGLYSMVVPAGSYFVKTFVSPEHGFINPEERSVTIADGETLTVNVQLKTADLAITGKVFLDNTPISGAFVWGWSQKGGYQESISQLDGSFLLNITGSDSWTIGAGTEINGVFYKSSEVALSVLAADVSHDIYLAKVGTLPSSVSKTFDASELNVVEVSGGPTVTAPASALATSGAVSISVSPDTSTPSQGAIKVVGVAYDFEAHDASGNIVSSFTTELTISMPYEEKDIATLGASEDELQIGFWDETVGTWKFLDKSVVNKEQNVVTGTVDHFTRFAIVATADITPPSSPSQVTATALGGGRIQLKWIPPVSDYHHAKIYRSQQAGQLGKIIAVEVAGNEFLDEKDITDKIVYSYTVRAVDGAGNESSHVAQASVQAQGSSGGVSVGGQGAVGLPPGQAVQFQLLRDLSLGSSGDDVKILQEFLIKENVYPEGLVTGYFGSLTKQAVIRFQEKYASEILQPFFIARGTGFVGPATRKKINELLFVAPGELLKGQILRNLTVGGSGEEVKLLQQLLLDEGVYPEGLVTGYFGSLTKQAVIRFQEKYASEILQPFFIARGTGFVGPATRKKINELSE